LQEGQSQRVINIRRQERHARIIVDEFIDENEDGDANDFNQALFSQRERIWLNRNFDNREFKWDTKVRDGLDRNLRSIKMKISFF